MINLFRPKTMRRMAVFAALVAPIVYLFGSLFTALAGAHGSQVFADSGSNVQEVSYSFERSFGLWVLNDGTEQTGNANSFTTSFIYPYPLDSVTTFNISSDFADNETRVSFYSDGQLIGTSNRIDDVSSYSFSLPQGANSFRVSVYSGSHINYLNYGDYPLVITSSSSSAVDYYSSVGFSDYIFGQFFAKDNFLVDWGRDAIGDNPHGFAPFGAFWRYLDTNVLHLSTVQVGLMAYGYMYYAAHVLLFDVGFMLVTFFLSFIQKVGDKIGGEER